MDQRAFITGVAGPVLGEDERAFLREMRPWGFILFKRNINSPLQVAELVESLRDTVGRPDAPVLIDQEGGRVQRLGLPHWSIYPPGAVYAALYAIDPPLGTNAARFGARLIGTDLATLGIDVDCLPVADVPVPGADTVIGDRAYGDNPGQVAQIAAAVAEGLMEAGVLPVLKHIPGHGRATADSHKALPVVDAAYEELKKSDFSAFYRLRHLPMAMTAHVVFSAIDPHQPATTSATMIADVIRGLIGFRGLLMSDDVSMNALSGSIGERTAAAFAAGCDVALHCNGRLVEMEMVAANSPLLTGEALARADAALAYKRVPAEFDVDAARAEFAGLTARVGWSPDGAAGA